MKLVAAAFAMCSYCLWAQAPHPVVSPEVHPDRTVTFRLRAPKASSVTFTADWLGEGGAVQHPMTKDAEGIWSITEGPLAPTIYIYSFTVDGVSMADPVNPKIKLRSLGSGSMVEVPSSASTLWEARDVPHGNVEINWEKAKALDGETRWIWIYTPPGYAADPNRRYPVLYLLHGSNDTAAGWTTAGNANFILDNLIAEKKVVPMIVVMPWGHAVPFTAPREQQAKNTAKFEEYLTGDVIPLVESKYRTKPGTANRAIAGLSMGADQAINIGADHLELFSAIAAFSAIGPRDFETHFPAVVNDAKGTNAKLKTFWIGCGTEDQSHLTGTQKFAAMLDTHGIRHTLRITPGGAHNYALWRQYLAEVLPLLFQ